MADRVLVAMSGGVDSSVSVKLLLDEGYDVAGATMRLYSNEDIGLDKTRTCCSLNDVEDARFVAFKLGIDFHVFNFSDDFKHYVIDNFVDTYLNGGTPNPCIECNKHLKFAKFYERAKLLGFDHIATGHYATKEYDEKSGRWLLKRSPDRSKDQSYVLYSMTQEQLAHTLFPVGEMHKDKIRDIAEENKLINANKPDSQDICFIPDGDYAGFITKRCGEQQSGDIVLTAQSLAYTRVLSTTLSDSEKALAFHIANRFSLLQRIWSTTGLLWARLKKYTVTALWQEM